MTVSQRPTRGDATLKSSNEIDVELLAFMERYATNLARWDLLLFFGQNPTARDTAHGIAFQLGRRTRIVQKELDDLTFLGILRTHENGRGMSYELARTRKTRRTIVRFAQRHTSKDRRPHPG